MKNKTVWIGGGLIVLAMAVYTMWIMPQVPDRIATHWGIDGKPDQWSDKGSGLWFGVGIAAAVWILMAVLPVISPKKARVDQFQGAWNIVALTVVLFMAFVQYLIVRAALGPFDLVRTMMMGMLIMFFIIGNVLGKAKRNYFMGIRTPWTLESEEVWHRTHRLAAKLMVGGSVLGMILLLTGINPLWTLPVILVATLYPCIYSYQIYRKLEPKNGSVA